MARSATPRNDPPLETSTPAGTALLESIPCSEDLQRRPSRPPDYEKENSALVGSDQFVERLDVSAFDAGNELGFVSF